MRLLPINSLTRRSCLGATLALSIGIQTVTGIALDLTSPRKSYLLKVQLAII